VKVLVTGATGFVGSQLAAELLRRGYAVRVLRRANSNLLTLDGLEVEHVLGDVTDAAAVRRAVTGCEVVYHVAAVSSYWRSQRDHIYRVNVGGTRNVMQACLESGAPRVVHTSTAAAVGLRTDGEPADEDTPYDDRLKTMPYSHSKHLAEQEVRAAVAQGLSAVIVNPVAVFGAGDHNMISSSMVVELARRPLPAVPPGGIAVADIAAVVAGHLAAAERGRDGERYILGGENLTYRQIAAVVSEVVGRAAPRWTIPGWVLPPAAACLDAYNRVSRRTPIASGEQVRLSGYNAFFKSDKAMRELGYPILPFRAAAEKAYLWYREHGYLA
jgi:dihydroflavonol-4-reductase